MVKSKDSQHPVLEPEKHSMCNYWVIKNPEVFNTDFDNLWVVLKLFQFDNWVEIKDTLKLYFDSNVIIGPLLAEKTLVDMDCGPLNKLLENPGKWQKFGPFI